jgi:hypothetical protein
MDKGSQSLQATENRIVLHHQILMKPLTHFLPSKLVSQFTKSKQILLLSPTKGTGLHLQIMHYYLTLFHYAEILYTLIFFSASIFPIHHIIP